MIPLTQQKGPYLGPLFCLQRSIRHAHEASDYFTQLSTVSEPYSCFHCLRVL